MLHDVMLKRVQHDGGHLTNKFRNNKMTKPRVLISDKMDPNAAKIFAERGCDVDVITDKTPEELAAMIGDYDGLAIRSSTKVTKAIRCRDQSEGHRPRRHRRRQCRHPRRIGQGRCRDEHAVRQLDHHRRTRHRPDVRARAPIARGERPDAGKGCGRKTASWALKSPARRWA